MTSCKKIRKILNQHKKELTRKYKVNEIGIFGSYIKGKQKKGSDLDILVEFEEAPDLLKFIELERYLQGLLKKRIDLVDRDGLRPRLRDSILNEVIYV